MEALARFERFCIVCILSGEWLKGMRGRNCERINPMEITLITAAREM